METKRLLPLLLLLLLALSPAAHAATAPDADVLSSALRGTPYEGYALTCQTFAMQYGEPGNASAYAIATRGGQSVLCAFEESNSGWHLRVANENALPDDATQISIAVSGQHRVVAIGAETNEGSLQLQFAIGGNMHAPYTWPLHEVMTTTRGADGKTHTIQVGPSEETGKWTFTENGEYMSYENRAYTCMDDFDLRDIPLTRAAADAAWHRGGTTIYIERDDGAANASLRTLSGQKITLAEDQKLPVYSGPGEEYLRGANGKAAVSTNEPLTVYATASDWVLIRYAVSSGERFGYIPRVYLPADMVITHNLYQDASSVGLTTREVAVLDNLSEADKPLCTFSYETPLSVWATLGDWLYVGGVSASGDSCCGFIPADAFHHTNAF